MSSGESHRKEKGYQKKKGDPSSPFVEFITEQPLTDHDRTFTTLLSLSTLGNAALQTAGGALGIITGFNAYYLAMGSFWSKHTSYFTVPLGDVSVKD